MNVDKHHQLSQFQRISQTMLEYAQESDWEKLEALEVERKSLIQSFFGHKISSQDSVQIEQTIQEVLSINDKITQLAEQEKVSVGEQLQGLKKRKNSHSAYLQNK